ncbi:MAG TPA: hypothetical protein VFV75_20195 [Candidatus Polarisedimenticolaceae bacterium]|nr:hypothetical protein [Candidatus Polarisedimenticolaceae bacterium]
MRAIGMAAGLMLSGLLGVGAAEPSSAPLEAMKAPMKELGTFLSNARFKLARGVSGMGGAGGSGGFSIKDCCAINVERMRGSLDTLAKDRTDLQRDYERARNAEGVAKLEPLATSMNTFEEGYKLLVAAKRPEDAMTILDGLLKSLNAMEAAHKDLAACCASAEK